MSHWRMCSFLCWIKVPAAEWTMHFGAPVVPLEYRIYSGCEAGS
jgi:hypothetical protein